MISRGTLACGCALFGTVATVALTTSGPGTQTPPARSQYARAERETDSADLVARHRAFLEQVDLILTPVERQVFLGLSEDYRRDAFIREFWQRRDPYPRTARNEFEEIWTQQQSLAADRYPDLEDDRYRLMAAFGAPSRTLRTNCELLRSLELWHFAASPLRGEFWAILLRKAGRYETWSPSMGLATLANGRLPLDRPSALDLISRTCSRGSDVVTAIESSPNWQEDGISAVLPQANDEWALTFAARSVEFVEEEEVTRLDANVSFPGRHQSRTITRIEVLLPVSELGSSLESSGDSGAPPSLESQDAATRVLVDGEIILRNELFETFRYRFDTPLDPSLRTQDAKLPITVQRFLRPGEYRLRMRVRDQIREVDYLAGATLTVPVVPLGTDAAKGATESFSAAETGNLPAFDSAPSVRLVVPRDELLIGRVRIAAEAAGEGFERVGFELDGRRVLTKRDPPYDVEVDIGRAPRMHQLRAFALDANGEVLAEDTLTLNAGPNSFSVRLVQPNRGTATEHRPGSWIQAEAEVEVPRLQRLERLEFFLDDTRLATLYQPPFIQPLRVPTGELSYVRVLAHLEEGGAAEDVVFLNAPDEIDYLQVDVVELWVSASDRRGRPITDLERSELRLRENGKQVSIERFERLREAPLHACVLLDVSISMEDRLRDASEAAAAFFERVLTDRDRACLMTFADQHDLVVPFTRRPETLAGGLIELEADGETALYDSLIHTMFYFNGIRGKRALVLLSDGEDSTSEYAFSEVLEFARRSGVAIYTIGLAIDRRQVEARAHLDRLARETGGRSYFVDQARELNRLYEEIEAELRSQYLISFQSTASGTEYRKLDLDVERRGVRVRTRGGYYP